jgi:50S ribosomal subunit-associated GTPase HflX
VQLSLPAHFFQSLAQRRDPAPRLPSVQFELRLTRSAQTDGTRSGAARLLGQARAQAGQTGENIAGLLSKMESMLAEGLAEVVLLIPYNRYDLVQLIYAQGKVLSKKDTAGGVQLRASVPASLTQRLAEFTDA